MDAYQVACEAIRGLSDNDLEIIKVMAFKWKKRESYPIPMSEEELINKLDVAKGHADQGMVSSPEDVVARVRRSYGL